MIKIPLDFLIKGIGVLFLLLIFLSIYMVVNGIRENIISKKQNRYILSKTDLWYRYFHDEISFSAELVPNNRAEIKGVEEIFLAYVENISSPAVKEKIRQFCNQYLKQYYSRLLSGIRWSTRMNALYRVISFEMDSLIDRCKKMQKKAGLSPEERFQLLIIHSVFDEADFIKEFVNLSANLSEYEYKKLLSRFDSGILKKLTYQINDFPTVYQYYFIDALGTSRNIDFLEFLESNLSHEDSEIRIRSLKAINEIGIVTDLGKYKVFLDSPVWEERLMLAKLLGIFPLELVYPYLEKLLQDENWWVRSNAARTIGNSKDGKFWLKVFIAIAKDRYAIEMAGEVLGEMY
ncbi:MAG: HEAT repeat domain-containing protein [Lachnospiraceae bacterium]